MNILGEITIRLDVPASAVERIAGPIDDSDEYHQRACEAVGEAIVGDPSEAIASWASSEEISVEGEVVPA